ncbi:MAG: hypothetical protein WAM41_16035, partial [Psychrobacillus psychrotolerans]
MTTPKKLIRYVQRARNSLAMEHYVRMLQAALFYGFSATALILLVSRLFVFPYYLRTSIIVGSSVFIGTYLYAFWKRPSSGEAVQKLDAYFVDNLLVSALSFLEGKSLLAKGLIDKAETNSESAFLLFKKRDKKYFKPKWIIGFVLAFAALLSLYVFPAATQLEAKDLEQEKEIVKELKKEVSKLEKKELSKPVKKELNDLKEKLKDLDIAEEALREVVKKQKELALKEQKLEEKKKVAEQEGTSESSLSTEEQKEFASLEDINNALAKSASNSRTRLSKMGKSLPYSAGIAQNNNSQSSSNKNGQQGQ